MKYAFPARIPDFTTVDGSEILHQLIDSLSQYLQGFIHPRWCRISAINSRKGLMTRIVDWSVGKCVKLVPRIGNDCIIFKIKKMHRSDQTTENLWANVLGGSPRLVSRSQPITCLSPNKNNNPPKQTTPQQATKNSKIKIKRVWCFDIFLFEHMFPY